MERFDSIAINYVLHCMPGALPEKGIAFANLKPLLNTSGVLFGSTVLRHGVPCDLGARAVMRLYNARKVPVVRLQVRMRDLARAYETHGMPVGEKYLRYSRIGFWLGVPAFSSVVAIFWLMIAKP